MLATPKHLSADGKKEWRSLVARLEEAGIALHTLDTDALEVVVTLRIRRRFFSKIIEDAMRDGVAYYCVGTNGAVAPHPAFSQEKQAADTLYKYLGALGLSPKTRAELLKIEAPAGDELSL